LFTPFARFEPKIALVLFKVQSTLFIWAGLLVLYFHLRKFVGSGRERQIVFFAIFAGAALLFQPFWTVYRVGGQTTPLIFLLLLLGLIYFTAGRFWIAAACYVLVVLIKPVFAPGLALLFLFSATRFRFASVLLSAIAAAGSILWLGQDVHMFFLEKLTEQGSKFMTPYFNSNMFAWVEILLLKNTDITAIATLPNGIMLLTLTLRIATIAGLVVILIRLLRSDAERSAKRHFAFVVSMVVPMILSPVVWAHYVAIFLCHSCTWSHSGACFHLQPSFCLAFPLHSRFFKTCCLLRKSTIVTVWKLGVNCS
ncbi:DUF2029 domain-containing protein, partial [Rhodobacteraceae bacterium R_SAG10]|nr:DUF2029 domain-containing protein [Rhodobacteraceae bacterium R_SAG10]